MKSNSFFLLFGLLFITAANCSKQIEIDNLGLTTVNLPEKEEDKKFSLENLSTTGEKVNLSSSDKTITTEIDQESVTAPHALLNGTQRLGRIIPQTSSAVAGQFPYFVLLTIRTRTATTVYCGGVLISDTWVVTAAQCVATASSISVAAEYISTAAPPPAIDVSPGIATIHPGYKKNYNIHDIALVRLQKPYTLSSNIYPIKLLKKEKHGQDLNSVTVRTMGFGVMSDTAVPPSENMNLNYVDLVQLSKSACNLLTAEIFVSYPPNTACLATTSSTAGFCLGDVGGPVVYTYPNELSPSLVGITSLYQGCPSAYPMSYTRIAPYYHWIKSIVKKLL